MGQPKFLLGEHGEFRRSGDPSMPTNPFDLSSRVALVTGGAQGLGRAIAEGLVVQGAAVAVADRNLAGAEATAASLRSQGHRAAAFACDVSQEADVRRMVAEV